MTVKIGTAWLNQNMYNLACYMVENGDVKFELVTSLEEYLEYTPELEPASIHPNITFNHGEAAIKDNSILMMEDDYHYPCDAVDEIQPFRKESKQLIARVAEGEYDDFGVFHQANPHMFGLRYGYLSNSQIYIELTRLDCTTNETLEEAREMVKGTGAHTTVVAYPRSGGFYERIRVPVELEVLRLVRHLNNPTLLVDHLTRTTLNIPHGILSLVRSFGHKKRNVNIGNTSEPVEYDSRFLSTAGYFPYENEAPFWTSLDKGLPETIDPRNATIPVEGNVLIVGAPQLVARWKKTLFEQSVGKVNAVTWPLWDLGEISEESVAPILKQGPYRLIIECLVSAVEDRQSLLDALLPSLMPKGMIWAHTLNAAATVTVQVVPEDTCAVGFGGLPPTDKAGSIELMRPASSRQHDLQRAAAMALHLGLTPYEVPDEPGGIGARTLAVLVNSTLFTVREGLVATPTEADAAAKALFNMQESPLQIADQVGLDVIEAVLLGLKALLGEERYRVCPLITMRIESGATGHASGKGFYAK